MVPGDAGGEAGGPAAAPSSGSGRGPRHPPPGGEVCSGLGPASPARPGSRLGGSRGSVGPAVRRRRPPAQFPPSHPPPRGPDARRNAGRQGPSPGGSGRATKYPARGPAAASQPRLRPGPVLKGEGPLVRGDPAREEGEK
ncbi:proline-rich proteoglycan 2-like [Rhinolophus ferrumequinum]|uniref:proline-rich proteoglycan 2-like n=1 Tax=Rhinolophus ferrumequinum TaxID=59479 RepID=UPI00140F4F32|nr:proline-rich proteoglycan 2-like [Rhinolophus ferrumequinum]